MEEAVQDIMRSEGFSSKAYWDADGAIWTIGFGTTFYEDGTPVKKGDVISSERAKQLVQWFIQTQVIDKVPAYATLKKITEKRALLNLIYNIGYVKFNKSKLNQHIITGNIEGIYKEWNWIYANGKAMRGLAKRRAEELALFLS